MDTLKIVGDLLRQAGHPGTDEARLVFGSRAYTAECCAAWDADLLAGCDSLRVVNTACFYGLDCDWSCHPDEVRLEIEGKARA